MLGRALLISIVLHAALIEGVMRVLPKLASLRTPPAEAHALAVRLRDVPAPQARADPVPPTVPPLMLPPQSPRHANAGRQALARAGAAPSPQRDAGPVVLSGAAARSALEQVARALLYPREAIEQGLEGQVTVLLFLDASGNVLAARLEASSGHALLDDAALRAARTLRSLPEGAPREALLPVRFRLR